MVDDQQLGFLENGFEQPRLKARAVREELESVLERARAADGVAPWDRNTHNTYLRVLTNKTKILPADEAEFMRRQLVFEFDRIKNLLVA